MTWPCTEAAALTREANLWAGAAQAHLAQARASMTYIAELELQIAETLEKADRLLRSARRDLEAVRVELHTGADASRPPDPA